MPGVVQQYNEAIKEVEAYAQKYDQHWEVREAFDDNLALWRRAFPEDTYYQSISAAIETTKHEILESYEIQQEDEAEAIAQREGLHIDQFHARYESPSDAFNEAYRNTRQHLDQRLWEMSTANYWDAQEGKSLRWTPEYERKVVQGLAISENQWIKQSQFETPGGLHATNEAYRHGAREAVIQFSHENNRRLKEAEQPRESNRESERVQFG